MPTFFGTTPGTIVQLTAPDGELSIPQIFNPKSLGLTFSACKAIVLRVGLGAQTNAQFLHTLGGDIYIYVFGDRIGGMTIEGLCGAYACGATGAQHGIEQTFAWYEAHKLSVKRAPLLITIGASTVFTAYLESFSTDVPNVYVLPGIMSFTLNLKVLPPLLPKAS